MGPPSRDFHHPYEPYEIQSDLMNAIYDCIANGKIGIFESPTGTGKSLSLICGSLTWLRDAQEEALQSQNTVEEGGDEPSWVTEHAQSERRRDVVEQKAKLEARLNQVRAKELRQNQKFERGGPNAKRTKINDVEDKVAEDDEEGFLLDDYESGDENLITKGKSEGPSEQGLSSTSLQLMETLGLLSKQPSGEDDLPPLDEIKIYFCSRTHSQLTHCGHIIPTENLVVMPVAKGPGSTELDFTYNKRTSSTMIEALGNCLVDLCNAIPDGLIVFFPSYAYLDQVVSHWQSKSTGTTKCIWDRLLSQKRIFRESKTTVSVDDILNQYSLAISTGTGGLLLSVIGGKMSEGINFSDALGRGVVVVGLPFPNAQSAQWKAKLEYIEQAAAKRTGSRDEGKSAARELYENACMRAVNQSIGRAIRHKGDYASILLLDKRYQMPRIEGKLPGWIRQGMVKGQRDRNFHEIVEGLKGFFETKKRT
ncbi:chromosome transmission fidelity protein 1, partial [Lecanoromycetidae sp. Uapishka_2]